MFQDTHIHIQDIKVAPAIQGFLGEAAGFGFQRFFNCAITPSDWPTVQSLSQNNSAIIPFYGFHPWFADLADKTSLARLAEYLALPGSLAGEMGLDKARKNIDFDIQKDVFAAQLDLAKKFHKPFAVHCVRAWPETISLIKAHAPGLKFLMHSFNGSIEIAREIEAMGGYLSVSVKEFTRPEAPMRPVFEALSKDRILLETDFPYQIKWTLPQDYLQAVRQGYEIAASWRGISMEQFIKDVYDNGTVFTH